MDNQYGIYTTDIFGKNHKQIAGSTWQQLSHPRVSPNHQWITFTRYTKKNAQGVAEELNGYDGTEVMLCHIDGSNLQTLIAAKNGILNCVSNWIDDNTIIWVGTENGKPSLMVIDIHTRKTNTLPTPKNLKTTDPHTFNNQVVFPVTTKVNNLWMMNLDGTNARQITFNKEPGFFDSLFNKTTLGDFDPKISPDGKSIAFMRLIKAEQWRLFVLNLTSKKEVNISSNNIDIVPDWSSNGDLIFAHINMKDLKKMGIYTMKINGSERKMLSLPREQVCNHPHYFPGSSTQIIYQSFRVPNLP